MSTTPKPIIIIGAGLSGLAAARLLTDHNIPVVVFDQSAADRSQGHGITLRDWAFKPLLEELVHTYSVGDMQHAVATDKDIGGTGWVDLTFRNNATGETLFNPEPPGPGQNKALFRANRSVLRDWLATVVDVRYEHKLVSVEGRPGDVKAIFENGTEHGGSMLVAADGVHSTVRTLLLGIEPEIHPVILFHGKAHMSKAKYDATLRTTLNESNVAAGVGDGFNTFITVARASEEDGLYLDWSYSRARRGSSSNADNGDKGKDKDPLWMPDRAELIKVPQHLLKEIRSRDLVPPFSTLVNADDIKRDKVFNWRIRSVHVPRTALDSEAAGRGVVFVGDAVHAMPIFGGEGGNHALLDGVELFRAVRAQCASAGSSQGDSKGMLLSAAQVDAAARTFYDGAVRRGQDAVRRCVQRFSGFHKPMGEWLKVAEMARKKAEATT